MCAYVRPCTLQAGEFHWGNELQGYIFGAFFYGYISTQILGGRLAERYGTKWLFGGSILSTAVLSVFTPAVALWSPYALIVLRILEGIGEVNMSKNNENVDCFGFEIQLCELHIFLKVSNSDT